MRLSLTPLALLCVCLAARAAAPSQRADYPELAQRGTNAVGVRQVEVIDPNRVNFLQSDLATGKVTLGDRHIFVTIWYPAASGDAKTVTHYDRHPGAGPGSPYENSAQFQETGLAIPDAAPQKGTAPLVILSHGFTNWAAYTSELAETLASRGYVVASIDHDDIPYKPGSNPGLAFVDTSSGRARDQRAVASRLRALSTDSAFPLAGSYDPDNLALIGYSMGGFGLLESAGAGYDANGNLFKLLPKPPFQGLLDDPAAQAHATPIPGLKALVLLAPWGGQPANRSWSAAALATISVPTLVVDGDHDDVAGFDEGVKWIYDSLKSSDRYLLVFENARHNIVGAEAPEAVFGTFSKIESFDEPVWRKDRIRAIDDHFIVAFLARSLHNDAAMDPYLNPPTLRSSDGTWPLKPGQNVGGTYAGKDQPNYWPGFQRRWALGLSLQHDKPSTK